MRREEQRRVTNSRELALPDRLAERVAAYALAAGAAGLGIMATVQPVEARIVYTAAHEVFSGYHPAFLDLNNDGTNDFRISTYRFLASFRASVGGAPGNGVRAIKTASAATQARCRQACRVFASRITQGADISAREDFVRGTPIHMDSGYSAGGFSYGPWLGNASGFLGLEFQIDGRAHYGWAEVHMTGVTSGVVTGYAYNTVPNQPIRAGQKSDADFIGEMPPQPATLGLLALGAPGLEIWRRPERE